MGLRFERRYESVMRRLPPAVAARFDLQRPSWRSPWGGPMNGQQGRVAIVESLLKGVPFTEVYETGTFRGTTTEFLANSCALPIHTVEAVPRNYEYARRRLRGYSKVDVALDDSREFIDRCGRSSTPGTAFFYLDAHWEDDLPLPGELSAIAAHWTKAVVLVDDFEVPDDAGYGFDDYGPGKRLSIELADLPEIDDWVRFYPTLPSKDETGERRGCLVIASPALSELVEQLPTLRQA